MSDLVLVPREPTEEMLKAAPASYSESFKVIWPKICGDIYTAMIASAPPQEGVRSDRHYALACECQDWAASAWLNGGPTSETDAEMKSSLLAFMQRLEIALDLSSLRGEGAAS